MVLLVTVARRTPAIESVLHCDNKGRGTRNCCITVARMNDDVIRGDTGVMVC